MMKHRFKLSKWISLILWAIFGCLVVLWLPNLSHRQSTHALESLPTKLSQTSSAQTVLSEGIEHFQSERYENAVTSWQQALDAYTQISDDLHQALVRSNLSLAHQHLGEWEDATTTLNESLSFFDQQAAETRSTVDWDYYAKALNTQGWLYLRQGQPEPALEAWRSAALAYQSATNFSGIVGSQINQAKALQSLGLSVAAREILSDVHSMIQEQDSSQLKAIALQSLGNALHRVGELEESQTVLEESWAIATQNLSTPSFSEQYNTDQRSILLDLGNTDRALWNRAVALSLDEADTHFAEALDHYQLAAGNLSEQFTVLRARAIANILSLLVDAHQLKLSNDEAFDDVFDGVQSEEIWSLWNDLEAEFSAIPHRRSGIEVQLNSVNSILKFLSLQQDYDDTLRTEAWSEVSQVLARSIQQARELSDRRTEALALGQLGNLYEQAKQWDDAKSLTEEAIAIAEDIQSPDIRYRWEWQLGRIWMKLEKPKRAVAAYTSAYESLKLVRRDLLTIDSDIQFSFRDNVEPVHRQLVDLLLRLDNNQNSDSENVDIAIEVIDSLQLAELENFLRCNFAQALSQEEPIELSELIDQLDPTAALIYPVILDDRLEIIFKLPAKEANHITISVEKSDLEEVILELQASILSRTQPEILLNRSEQLYDWIIRPLEPELTDDTGIKTLVFVLDGLLRNIPMSVLYDGDRYFIEKDYDLAIVPSLQLFDLRSPQQDKLSVLAAGVSQEQILGERRFSALPNVPNELQTISEKVSTNVLLNQAFTRNVLEQRVKSGEFSAVHIATHGKFSSDPQETYIAAYKELLKGDELNNVLRTETRDRSEYIDLLVLSACETARGDNRATLGLAGIAVRAGARSTMSTLWQISDQSTAFMMQHFYEELEKPNVSRAGALHRAQLALFKDYGDKSPFTWAPYILVGNWL